MEIPAELILSVMGTTLTTIGAVIIIIIRLGIKEIQSFKLSIESADRTMTGLILVVGKIMTIQSLCKNCPKPKNNEYDEIIEKILENKGIKL